MNKLKCIPAALIFALIMSLSWYGRVVQTAIRSFLGLEGLIVFVCIITAAFVFLSVKIFRLKEGYARLLLVLYPLGIYILRANPEEAVHLMEYGAFALSLSFVLADHFSENKTFAYASLGAVTLGILDETFQGINPSRVFDIRDMIINSIGAILTAALFIPKKNGECD